jgi:translation initiation factor IF-1
MPKEELISVIATVEQNLSNGVYSLKMVDADRMIQARLCGKMTKRSIRIIVGDIVSVEVSPYDLTKGRITWRHQVVNGQIVQRGQERSTFNSIRRKPGEKHWRGRK